jgi:hypothetical protein
MPRRIEWLVGLAGAGSVVRWSRLAESLDWFLQCLTEIVKVVEYPQPSPT